MKDMLRMKASNDPRSLNKRVHPRKRKRRFNNPLKQPLMKLENLQLKKT